MPHVHALRSASWSKKRSRLGARYVYGSRHDTGQDEESSNGHDSEERNPLDPNHSHFVLVDDGSVGAHAYGSEIGLRTELETEMVSTCFGIDEVRREGEG